MQFEFTVTGEIHTVTVEKNSKCTSIDLGEGKVDVQYTFLSPNCCLLVINGNPYRAYLAKNESVYHVFIHGEKYQIVLHDSQGENLQKQDSTHFDSGGEICAPMPGKILKILVKEKEKVVEKQSLAIVEAMKMEHDIRSPIAGVVKKINFAVNDLVDTGQPIIEIAVG